MFLFPLRLSAPLIISASLVLSACAEKQCEDGFATGEDGNCYPEEADTDTDTDTDSDTDSDTDTDTDTDSDTDTDTDTDTDSDSDTDSDTDAEISPDARPDFSLQDYNNTSPTTGEAVSPRDYLEKVSGWYFTHAT